MKKKSWAAAVTLAAAFVCIGYLVYKDMSDFDLEIDWDLY